MWSIAWRCLLGVGLLLLPAPLAGAVTPAGADQGEVVEAGREVYLRTCASCHGAAATGYGPAATTLRQRPADLTGLSDRTRPFRRDSVRAVITGSMRLKPTQGNDEMPHWRGSLDGPAVGGRVTELDALLAYLETIQREPYGVNPGVSVDARSRAGAPLFATYCAGCHGPDGRGVSAPGSAPPSPPPDLTTLASRHGGKLDVGLLYEWIARGRHEGGMPAWDSAFRRAGWPAVVTTANIQALARYVESIQRR